MIASALALFSAVNTNGVSALFSGVSLWRTMVSPPSLALEVVRDLVMVLAALVRKLLANIFLKFCKQNHKLIMSETTLQW